jgi:hypothetical protein
MQRVLITTAVTLILLGSVNAGYSQTDVTPLADNCSGNINTWICSLDPFYNPVPDPTAAADDPNYKRPVCQDTDQATGAEKTFVMSVINQTTGQLRKDLCSLNNIFIMKGRAVPHSWGFYEDPTYHTQQNKYTAIALNERDLYATFSTVQDQVRFQLGIMNGSHSESSLPTNLVPETWGLLYVLAHEMGHIKWHRDQTCKNTISGAPWSDISQSPRWTVFSADFGTRDTSSGVPKPRGNLNSAQLKNTYTGDFATALAASNPEEDFVESYALRAVKKICGAGCQFRYTLADATAVSLLDNARGSTNLKNKINCADSSQ